MQLTIARPGVLGTTLFAGALALSSITGALAQDATPTAEVGIIDEAIADLPECPATDPGAVPDVDAAQVYTIDANASQARYIVMEELASVGANEVVGTTAAIAGNLLFDADGAPLACSQIDVDLRTLETDEARRDNYLRGNTLETDTYPVATFSILKVEGLNGPLTDGEETDVTLIGNLTFHGVTKLAAWEATVQKDGETITGSASTEFDFTDFDIEKPIIGPVVSIADTVTLEFDLTAVAAAE